MIMTDDRQERIRSRAHRIWLQEGQPAGHHERHWHQAATDIDEEDAQAKSAAREPAKKAGAGKAKGKAKAAAKEAKAAKPKAGKSKKAAK